MPEPINRQPEAYTSSGREVDVDLLADRPEELNFKPDAQVFVQKGSERFVVPAKDLHLALKSGARVLSNSEIERQDITKEEGTVAGAAKTAAFSALRGASGGLLSGALADAMGEDFKRRQMARQEIFSPVSAAGEIAGGLLGMKYAAKSPGTLRGALGLPARGINAAGAATRALVTNALGSGRAASALGSITGMAVEGGIYGLGTANEQAILEGRQLDAESALTAIGWGGAFGVGGLGAGKAIAGAGRAAARLLPSAEAMAARLLRIKPGEVGGTKKLIDGVPSKITKLESVGRELLDYRLQTGPNVGRGVFEASGNNAKLLANIDTALTESADRVRGIAGEAQKHIDLDPSMGPNLGAIIERRQAEIMGPIEAKTMKINRMEANRLRIKSEWVDEKLASGIPVTLDDLISHKREVDATAWAQKLRNRSLQVDGLTPLQKYGRIVSDEIEAAVERVAAKEGIPVAAWRDANRAQHAFVVARNALQEHLTKQASASATTFSDRAAGAVGALMGMSQGGLSSVMFGAGAAGASKLIREYGPVQTMRVIQKFRNLGGGISAAVDGVTAAGVGRTIALAANTQRQQNAHMLDRVRAMERDPSDLHREVSRRIDGSGLPDTVAMQAAAAAADDVGYLASRAPIETLRTRTLTPQAAAATGRDSLDPGELGAWAAAARALGDTEEFLESMAHGDVPHPAAVAAIKERRPAIYASLRARLAENLLDQQTEVPFQRRIYLSLLFDLDGDESLAPGTMVEIQQTYQAKGNAQPPAAAGSRGRVGGRIQPGLLKRIVQQSAGPLESMTRRT